MLLSDRRGVLRCVFCVLGIVLFIVGFRVYLRWSEGICCLVIFGIKIVSYYFFFEGFDDSGDVVINFVFYDFFFRVVEIVINMFL